jgi:acetamidase/formamidase
MTANRDPAQRPSHRDGSVTSAPVARVDAGAKTVHWGYFDARLSPVLTVESGDRVTISTVSGGPELLPPPPFEIPPALREIHAANGPQRFFGHMCTGPVAVRGAKAGRTLQVDIEKIEPHYNWGHNVIRPLAGALPADFPEARLVHIMLDRERKIWRLPWGQEVPFRPFFGVMAVAPPPAWGVLPTPPPRRNGGNMDNKELVEGATLYLPIFADGALFSVGDGHGAQGDGEVCITAVETGLVGTFRLTVRDDIALEWPRAETPTHMITMAFDPDLDDCVAVVIRQMLDIVCERTGIDRYQAYTLLSIAADLRITQVVNGNKGVHLMLDKRYLDPVVSR